jgi:formylmethanofuran dehydrogenase subunit B
VSRRDRSSAAEPAACIDGAAAGAEAALDRATALLASARRLLVTGLADTTLEAIQAACDLAEVVGGAIDAAAAEVASPAAPLVARAGSITADIGELRDRADLVLLWQAAPDALEPGFAADVLAAPLADGSRREVIVVGQEALAGGRHLPLPGEAAVDAARLLEAMLRGHPVPPGNPAADVVARACRELEAAIREARCVGIVSWPAADPLGLSDWAVSLLVRTINHERPAFRVPLAASPAGRLANAAGAAAVLTWRYGAGGAIARADRLGGDFRPAECSAATMIDRGEVDLVLAVGRLPPEVEGAIASRSADLAVIRVDDRSDEPPGCAGPCIHLRCGPPVGTILRADGREQAVGANEDAGDAASIAAVLESLRDRLSRESRS